MELRHLRYFVALAEELHFARAAERLNIAPPTLTVQIQEIERSLSARLLHRTKRSVALTPAGEIFLAEARNVLDQYAKAESVGRRAGRGEIGRVEIGYVGSAAYAGVLQYQMSAFSERWPGVQLNAREFPMDALPHLIAGGTVDIGFVRMPVAMPRSLRMHTLLRDYFCLAAPSSLYRDIKGDVRAARLSGASFIAPEQESGTYEVAKRGGFKPDIVAAPGSLLAVLTHVSLGAGVAVIPSVVRNVVTLPGVTFHRIAGEPVFSEVAAVFRSSESSPTVKHFVQQLHNTPPRQISPLEW
ncbi:MAG: LysR family transcriptional regulator [Shinella sp. 65-6]|nr:LysR family transcriptional regulator [Hyphomicrobiales bacterium]OJU89575.1 MAG: LysR family transcriptional regulator [Shinella sp. 65-6]